VEFQGAARNAATTTDAEMFFKELLSWSEVACSPERRSGRTRRDPSSVENDWTLYCLEWYVLMMMENGFFSTVATDLKSVRTISE
jgi:hypothetical protein